MKEFKVYTKSFNSLKLFLALMKERVEFARKRRKISAIVFLIQSII